MDIHVEIYTIHSQDSSQLYREYSYATKNLLYFYTAILGKLNCMPVWLLSIQSYFTRNLEKGIQSSSPAQYSSTLVQSSEWKQPTLYTYILIYKMQIEQINLQHLCIIILKGLHEALLYHSIIQLRIYQTDTFLMNWLFD